MRRALACRDYFLLSELLRDQLQHEKRFFAFIGEKGPSFPNLCHNNILEQEKDKALLASETSTSVAGASGVHGFSFIPLEGTVIACIVVKKTWADSDGLSQS
jgi:hypothetical protein